jgi:hypothetical protein
MNIPRIQKILIISVTLLLGLSFIGSGVYLIVKSVNNPQPQSKSTGQDNNEITCPDPKQSVVDGKCTSIYKCDNNCNEPVKIQ